MVSTLTSKGQITLPKHLRDRLKLKTGDQVEFFIDDEGRVELVPVTASVKRLKGMLPKPKKAVTLEAMDQAIRQRAGRS
jgi:antitoxin PrlF